MWLALEKAWTEPYAIASNYAREKRWAVGFAASVGWLTVVAPDGLTYGNTWHITAEGLTVLEQHFKEQAGD